MYSCTDLELEVEIHMDTKEYMWIHDDTPRYTGYIQNTEKIRILDTIHAKYTKIRIEAKQTHLGGKTGPYPGSHVERPRRDRYCRFDWKGRHLKCARPKRVRKPPAGGAEFRNGTEPDCPQNPFRSILFWSQGPEFRRAELDLP